MEEATVLQHQPFASTIDIGFWSELSTLKLDTLRLDDAPRSIWGSYECGSLSAAAGSKFLVGNESLNPNAQVSARFVRSPGIIKVVNTVEAFKDLDKKKFIEELGNEILNAIDCGAAIDDPSMLPRWVMLTFSNLKTYCHHYWLEFSAVSLPAAAIAPPPVSLSARLSPDQQAQLHLAYKAACDR
jgi:ubiquitin-like modifier-activating enzyme ATG7